MSFLQKLQDLLKASSSQTSESGELATDVAEREQPSQVTIASGIPSREDWKELNRPHFERTSHLVTYVGRGRNGGIRFVTRDVRTKQTVEPRSAFALEVPDE